MGEETRGQGMDFGIKRVLEPEGVLPQAAKRLDASLPIFNNEVLLEVLTLNIDSASFQQMKEQAGLKKNSTAVQEAIAQRIMENVRTYGKQVNPVTGSGGMLIGKIKQMGSDYKGPGFQEGSFQVGDHVATLVSLTLTPLFLQEIKKVYLDGYREAQMDVKGHAILFDGAPAAKLPSDLPQAVALSVLDVCGAPAQVHRLVQKNQRVLILGAGGKSGLLCLHETRKQLGKTGTLMAIDYSPRAIQAVQKTNLADQVGSGDAQKPTEIAEKIRQWTQGQMADLVINTTNVSHTEMACILSVRPGGKIYFFNMATNFARAALGAEGVGKDVEMLIGNGFTPGHALLALNVLRENPSILEIFQDHD